MKNCDAFVVSQIVTCFVGDNNIQNAVQFRLDVLTVALKEKQQQSSYLRLKKEMIFPWKNNQFLYYFGNKIKLKVG